MIVHGSQMAAHYTLDVWSLVNFSIHIKPVVKLCIFDLWASVLNSLWPFMVHKEIQGGSGTKSLT